MVAEKLSSRFCTDQTFRSAVLDAVEKLPADQLEGLPGDRITREGIALSNDFMRYHLVRITVDLDMIVDDIESDFFYMVQRLSGTGKDTYDEYDRGQAEGDFRLAMSAPIACLFGVLAVRLSVWWWAGVLVAVILAYVGVQSRLDAELKVVWAIAAGRVDDPRLQRLEVVSIAFLDHGKKAV
jgi:hypothetical protein